MFMFDQRPSLCFLMVCQSSWIAKGLILKRRKKSLLFERDRGGNRVPLSCTKNASTPLDVIDISFSSLNYN